MLRAARPLWLVTLADLSLLLVGFFVLMQATARKDARAQAAISAGIRDAFGGDGASRLAVDANAVTGFAAGGVVSAADPGPVRAWAADALADPRTFLLITGYADGSPADRLEGSALALAGARADRVALALHLPAARIRTAASGIPGMRRVTLSITYDP